MFIVIKGSTTPSNELKEREVQSFSTVREVERFFSDKDPSMWSVIQGPKIKVNRNVEVCTDVQGN